MKKKYRNIMLIAAGIIVFAIVLIQILLPVRVSGVVVAAREYTESIKDEGILYATKQGDLYAPQSLLIKSIYVQEGEAVEEGQLLVEFDDELIKKQFDANQTALEMQILNLKAELSLAVSQKHQYSPELTATILASIKTQINSQNIVLEGARTDYHNAQVLYGDGFISQSELDKTAQIMYQAEALVTELRATYDKTKAQMEAMRNYYQTVEDGLMIQIEAMEELLATGGSDAQSAQLAYFSEQASLRAPFTGTVLSINGRAGNMADVSRPTISVYQEDGIIMEAYLLAADAAIVTAGMEVAVTIDGKEKQIVKGMVLTVSAYATEQVSTLGIMESRVKVEIVLFIDEAVIVGQKADAEFIIRREMNGIGLPKSCVFAYEDGYAVIKVMNKKAVLVPVEKDFETDTMVVIKNGVTEGDVVLVSPSTAGVKDGKRVWVDYQ